MEALRCTCLVLLCRVVIGWPIDLLNALTVSHFSVT